VKIRTILILVVLIAAVATATWGWWRLHEPGTLPIKAVKVSGQYHFVTPDRLQKTVLPFVSNGFFNVDVTSAQSALLQLPGVANSSVRRVWPDVVLIKLTELVAVAHWGKQSLTTATGKIFTPQIERAEKVLPTLWGNKRDVKAMLKLASELAPMLQKSGLSLAALKYDALGDWQATTASGFVIDMGYKNMQKRLGLFLQAYPKLVQVVPKNKKLAYVNLQYKHGFAVKYGNKR